MFVSLHELSCVPKTFVNNVEESTSLKSIVSTTIIFIGFAKKHCFEQSHSTGIDYQCEWYVGSLILCCLEHICVFYLF